MSEQPGLHTVDLTEIDRRQPVQSRYQRRSGRLPRLADQPDADFSFSVLPRPLVEPSGPVALLRNLLSV